MGLVQPISTEEGGENSRTFKLERESTHADKKDTPPPEASFEMEARGIRSISNEKNQRKRSPRENLTPYPALIRTRPIVKTSAATKLFRVLEGVDYSFRLI